MESRKIISALTKKSGADGSKLPRPALDYQPSPTRNIFLEHMESNKEFFDNSLFIRDILKYSYNSTLELIFPHGSGKSMNLSMLYNFYRKDIDTNHLFSNLEIANYPDEMKLQGKYSVVFLDISDISLTNVEDVTKQLLKKVSDLFNQHKYVLENKSLNYHDRNDFENIMTDPYYKNHTPGSALDLLLKTIGEYNKNILKTEREFTHPKLLIDGCDVALKIYSIELTDAERVLYNLFLLLKARETHHSHVILISSTFYACLTNELRGNYYTIHDEDFSRHFGLKSDEVEHLFKRAGLLTPCSELKPDFNYMEQCFCKDNNEVNKLSSDWKRIPGRIYTFERPIYPGYKIEKVLDFIQAQIQNQENKTSNKLKM